MARNDFVGLDIEGMKETQHILKNYPDEASDAATEAAAKYLIDVFKVQPPRKKVSRKRAYGASFFSDKQRRWFFAALKSGEIKVPYNRTQGMRKAWNIIGRGKNLIIVNQTQAAVYTMGDQTQSRHEKLVGWQTTGQKVSKSIVKMQKVLRAAADKTLKKLGAT